MTDLIFAPEPEIEKAEDKEPWTVLVADDEGTVHLVTEMVLRNFKFQDRPVKLISTYSGEETIDVMSKEHNIAVILLDVIMESITAGLDVVSAVREKLNNNEVRIILRTGQAGVATISEVIKQYDINGYKKKENLTNEKLQNTVTLALRAYNDIQRSKEK